MVCRTQMVSLCMAYGDHANDDDSVRASIKFSSELELLRVMHLLGISPNILPDAKARAATS